MRLRYGTPAYQLVDIASRGAEVNVLMLGRKKLRVSRQYHNGRKKGRWSGILNSTHDKVQAFHQIRRSNVFRDFYGLRRVNPLRLKPLNLQHHLCIPMHYPSSPSEDWRGACTLKNHFGRSNLADVIILAPLLQDYLPASG
jgi:hypothetical protein